ncbi:MAG: protein tyrosine phosphatase family protein [Planctomycetota bacterium]|jgi:uncharacterized protein (TIGR01244 family)
MSKALLLLIPCAILLPACSSSTGSQDGHDGMFMEQMPLLSHMFEGDEGLPVEVDIPNYTILSEQVAGGGYVTADQVATLPGKGYSTIINLRYDRERGVEEEIAAAEAAGLIYVSIPVGGSNFTLEDAKRVSEAIEQSPGNVLFHCASGGRVSAVWALTRAIEEGLTPEEAKRVAAEGGCRPIPESMTNRVAQELREGMAF